MSYSVYYMPLFHAQLMELSDAEYEKVEHSIDLLSDNPYTAKNYNPAYPAAMPPIDFRWRWVPKTYKIIYFTIDETTQAIYCYVLGDARQDPLHRFDNLSMDL